MKPKKTSGEALREELLQFCGEVHEDDGIDPRLIARSRNRLSKPDRKAMQLCRQVSRTLELVLNDCDDDVVQAMSVVSVDPAPDSSCMLVSVYFDASITSGTPVSRDELMGRMANQTSRLRFEIARSINRKRVPNLTWSISCGGESLNSREPGR